MSNSSKRYEKGEQGSGSREYRGSGFVEGSPRQPLRRYYVCVEACMMCLSFDSQHVSSLYIFSLVYAGLAHRVSSWYSGRNTNSNCSITSGK